VFYTNLHPYFFIVVNGSWLAAALNVLHCVRNVLMSDLCRETDNSFPWLSLVPSYKSGENILDSNLNPTASSGNIPPQHSLPSHQLMHLVRCTDRATQGCSLRVSEHYRTLQIDLPWCESIDTHRDWL
jgi:hypothetical protein